MKRRRPRRRGVSNRVRARNRALDPGPDPEPSSLEDASAIAEPEHELPPYIDPDRPSLGRQTPRRRGVLPGQF